MLNSDLKKFSVHVFLVAILCSYIVLVDARGRGHSHSHSHSSSHSLGSHASGSYSHGSYRHGSHAHGSYYGHHGGRRNSSGNSVSSRWSYQSGLLIAVCSSVLFSSTLRGI